ncbi:hypothetical protein DMI70_12730 [Escherichia coli]|nr:hypothetical protein [Escherichia coli]
MYRYSIKKAGSGKITVIKEKGKISNNLNTLPFPAEKGRRVKSVIVNLKSTTVSKGPAAMECRVDDNSAV